MNPATLLELLSRPEFLAGAGWGAVAAVLLLIASRWVDPAPMWGPAVAAAAFLPFAGVEDFGWNLPLGLVLVVGGGLVLTVARTLGRTFVFAGTLILVTDPLFPDDLWIRAGTLAFVLAGGWAIGWVDNAAGHTGLPALMFAVSVFGVWAGVPDTEFASILMGVILLTVFMAWPRTRAQIGSGGGYALTFMLAIAIVLGGAARPPSIVGGWAVLGLFWVVPWVAIRLAQRRWAVFAVHVVVMVVTARIAGLNPQVMWAVVIAGIALVIGAVLVMLIERWRPDELLTAGHPDQ